MSYRSLPQAARAIAVCLVANVVVAGGLHAQVTPAAGYIPPDDTPAIRIGVTIFTDYTLTKKPKIVDADGDSVSLSSFNVARAYLNVTGNVSHLMAFRITPDISRETGAGASLAGSLEYRLKYAFGQFNLDDWAPRGSWIRFGVQQTPWVDFQEGIYRYRFQGTVFSEREGFLSSSDAGISAHFNLPSNFGDFHVGMYNGETYSKAETNDQKALQARFTLRPFATQTPILRGLRASVFYDGDHYVADGNRTRLVAAGTFEHTNLNAGVEYVDAHDRTSGNKPAVLEVEGKGISVFATPRLENGWEALIRYDHLTPNEVNTSQVRKRTIVGIAYWLPHQGTVSSGWMLDIDNTAFDAFVPALPTQTKLSLHGLISY